MQMAGLKGEGGEAQKIVHLGKLLEEKRPGSNHLCIEWQTQHPTVTPRKIIALGINYLIHIIINFCRLQCKFFLATSFPTFSFSDNTVSKHYKMLC